MGLVELSERRRCHQIFTVAMWRKILKLLKKIKQPNQDHLYNSDTLIYGATSDTEF